MKRRGEEEDRVRVKMREKERGARERVCVCRNSLLGVSEHGNCVGLLDHHWLQGDLFGD